MVNNFFFNSVLTVRRTILDFFFTNTVCTYLYSGKLTTKIENRHTYNIRINPRLNEELKYSP